QCRPCHDERRAPVPGAETWKGIVAFRSLSGLEHVDLSAMNMQSQTGSSSPLACSDRRPAGRNESIIESLTVTRWRAPVWLARAPTTAREARALPIFNRIVTAQRPEDGRTPTGRVVHPCVQCAEKVLAGKAESPYSSGNSSCIL